ncbi:TonB-linked SusC/RagA family outer membrane protein [Chryseobacterium sediminis]|uniref:TonB-linked SusC/RagA family outer membrane protein n=1 Tax=Chryseobacterium sediminis TaxID=1679494 RepID=A0ABR6Q265_9FLAO|nr:SusC/RagA family TonB-linked outer membrane protein [Chryseobacterium sediminis]MBB6331786.1 TonB-linked SusC/RagA family outer membrane protein [Chryseobacterium sediminis]
MKKLTMGVLVVVLSSSVAIVNAQQKKNDSTTQTKEIEGVVVTALGIKREKKSLGYASQEIKADKLTEGTTKTGNVADLLSGKAAGVLVNSNGNFGGSTNIVIRGIKTLQGSNPLVVIDGSPVNNSSTNGANFDLGNALSDINQEDIESMNILKGAAASALYGERGLNGVIVITTKSGRGKDDGSWGVTLNSGIQAGFIDKSTFPVYQNKYGGGYDPSFYSGTAPDGHDYANFSEDASWGPKFDPNLLVYQWDSFDPHSQNYGKATPWVAAKNGPIKFFDTPVTYANTISLEKGTKAANFTLTYDNMLSNGLLPNSDLKKNTLSTKINYDFTPKLHATVYSTLTLQNTKGRNETGYSDNVVTGFRQWWQTNVDVKALENAYINNNHSNFAWNRVSADEGQPIFWNNPYFQRYQNYQSDNRTRTFSYAQLKYDISKHIGVTGKISFDKSDVLMENRLAVGSLSQSFGASGKDVGSGYARLDINRSEINYDLIFNYKYDITPDLNISGVVGGNVRRNYYNSISASTEGGLIAPKLYALGNSRGAVLDPAEDEYTTQTNSAYVTASIDYKKIFYLDGTFRIDESSTLPKGNNVYNYPSITGSLILSELIKAPFLSFWKVRANYAEVGGTADPYLLYPQYRSAGLFGTTKVYNSQTDMPNQNLRPQRSKEVEFGMEAQLFKNRISFDVAYYKTRTFDQIISLPISSGSGLLRAPINAGQINNEGVEVQLGFVPIKSKDFAWNIDVNWAKNKNLVVSLLHNSTTDVSNILLNSFQGGVSLNAREGESWGTLIGSDYVYLNGQPVINPTTGRYLRQNNQVIGNATPDWTGGVRNSFSYKGISLSFLIDVKHGGDVFSLDQYYGLATGLYAETGDYRESGIVWEGVNPNGQINTTVTANPSAFGNMDGYSRMPAKRFVYDGSYVKLREASIGYTLPKSLLAGTFVNMAKISIVGRNLWIIHKNLPYADPEAMVGGSSIRSYGFSTGTLPTTRNIGIDVTLKF